MNTCPTEVQGYTTILRPGALRVFLAALLVWLDRARQRRHLARLDDRLLKDIGLDRSAAECETAKPFWVR